MKLKDIKTYVTVPPTGIGGSFWVIVKITAEGGEDGFGVIEATPPLGLPVESVLPILGIFKDVIIGREVGDHLQILADAKQRLFSLNYSFNPCLLYTSDAADE